MHGNEIMSIIKNNPSILQKYYVKKIGLFGSYSRGGETEKSDIDLLVEFDESAFDDNYIAGGIAVNLIMSSILGVPVTGFGLPTGILIELDQYYGWTGIFGDDSKDADRNKPYDRIRDLFFWSLTG